MEIVIDHTIPLTLAQIMAVGKGAEVRLAPATRTILAQRRRQVEALVKSGDVPAYGFNRGFGHNVDLSVKDALLADLQLNLIRSHAVGVGDSMDETIVRITMLLRANSLALGYSGIRPELIESLVALLNNGITPLVPEMGSVGASGDLAPLSHIAMALLGEGQVLHQKRPKSAREALRASGIQPLQLEMKEGLALNNGVQFMNAMGLYACDCIKTLLRTAAVTTAMVAQVMLAPDSYFRPDFHAVRPHPGALRVADWIWRLMQGSPLRDAHKDFKTDGQVQDPYNIRCAAQILGACHDLISQAERALLVEANSATDNPILLADDEGRYTDIVSGGHFHGMPVAVQVYNLLQALSIMTSLAHTRSVRFVDPARNKGLGRDLKWPNLNPDQETISSGMMMLEYTSAALTNDLWGQVMPSHLFNISTNAGQEDHVSMGAGMAVRLLKTLPKAAHVLAIELAYTHQAIAIRKQLKTIPTETGLPPWAHEELLGLRSRMQDAGKEVVLDACIIREHPLGDEEKRLSPVSEAVFESAGGWFPIVKKDRYLAPDVKRLATHVLAGGVLETVAPYLSLEW